MIGYSFRSKPGTYFRGQFEAYELVSEHGGETYEIVIFQTPNLDLKTLKDSSNNSSKGKVLYLSILTSDS